MERTARWKDLSARDNLLGLSLLMAGTLLIAATLILLSGEARAKDPAGTPDKTKCPYLESQGAHAGAWCPKKTAAALKLTEEQQEKIQAIRSAYQKEADGLKTSIHEKKASLHELFRNPEASRDQILEAQRELVTLKSEKMNKAMEARLQARSILTPEQIRELPQACWLGIGERGKGKGCGGDAGCGKCPYKDKGPHGKSGCTKSQEGHAL